MERTAWTDERLDDLAARMDVGFDRVDRDICDLRTEMREGFAAVDRRFESMDRRFESMDRRYESMENRFDARLDAMHELMLRTHTTMLRLSWAMVICLIGAIAAFSLGG